MTAATRAGVLLDVDGTLLDSNYLHTLAWWRGLRDLGHWAPMNAIHRLIGMGGEQLVPELLVPFEEALVARALVDVQLVQRRVSGLQRPGDAEAFDERVPVRERERIAQDGGRNRRRLRGEAQLTIDVERTLTVARDADMADDLVAAT